MTTEAPPRSDTAQPPGPAGRPLSARLLAIAGWTLIAAGSVVALYVVYAMFFTDLATEREQRALLEAWEAGELDAVDGAAGAGSADAEGLEPEDPTLGEEGEAQAPAGEVGGAEAVALLEFHRPGSDERPVVSSTLVVIGGVTVADLQRGPGHYPDTAMPGEDGNFAVAGHRVTYGRPFFRLDEIEPGDEIHVVDRDGERFVYEVASSEVVGPYDGWVLDEDPLETGEPTLTLTTCHPRFSAAERLVTFAELRP